METIINLLMRNSAFILLKFQAAVFHIADRVHNCLLGWCS